MFLYTPSDKLFFFLANMTSGVSGGIAIVVMVAWTNNLLTSPKKCPLLPWKTKVDIKKG